MTPSAIGWSLHMGGKVGEGGRILGEGGADSQVQPQEDVQVRGGGVEEGGRILGEGRAD